MIIQHLQGFAIILLFCSLPTQALAASRCARHDESIKSGEMVVQVSRYSPAHPEAKTIMIVPPTGGTNVIDRSYARTLCRQGFVTYTLNDWGWKDGENYALELHQGFYGRALEAIRTVTAQLPKGFIGLLGTSVGALHASVAASSIPELDAVFVIVGGTSIPSVVVHSDQPAMRFLKQKRYEMYGFKNDDEYLAALTPALTIDPLKLPHGFQGKTLGMAIADHDTTVSTPDQLRLRDLWQPQTVIHLSNNHFWGIVNTWLFHSQDIVQFFQKSADSGASKH